MAKDLGESEAVRYYEKLLAITHGAAAGVDAHRWLWYGDFLNSDDLWDKGGFDKKLQEGEDLGARMKNAFKEAFDEGFEQVVIIGSDCPEISTELLETAFEKLNHTDVVTGPANDGGYYLLGMKAFHNLFDGIAWSTGEVHEATLEKVRAGQLTFGELPVLTDLDTIEDLKKLKKI